VEKESNTDKIIQKLTREIMRTTKEMERGHHSRKMEQLRSKGSGKRTNSLNDNVYT